MKLAIMQPYFFPYLGYFQLLNAVDEFILIDVVQYIRHGWINRNRILKPNTGHQYIIAPLAKHHQSSLINEIEVIEGNLWKHRILGQIDHYKKKAPHFTAVKSLLESCFAIEQRSITELNAAYLRKVGEYIGIETPVKIASHLNLDYSEVQEKDDWALTISQQVKATAYINPIGGRALFNNCKFEKNNISLHFLKSRDIEPAKGFHTVSNLSIIDVMLFNSPDEIKGLLKEYDLT